MKIAIVAVAYNRVDSLSRLLASLDRANYPLKEDITLIISVDKSKNDIVEKYADAYQWIHGDKIVDKHEKNLGLRPHMMSLGKWFDRFDAIVVLEDDIVVSPNYYHYTKQTVEKYSKDSNIAGISLYSFGVNYQTGKPFEPLKDEHDVFFMNCAMSWGEVWMRESWLKFNEWYQSHQEFPVLPHLPKTICAWNSKSWLKYHTRYCIEENKYFVFPFVSLSTNYSDAGVHSKGRAGVIFQVVLQEGNKTTFQLPDNVEKGVRYDGFFENKILYKLLGYNEDEIWLGLQNSERNPLLRHYWVTTLNADYKVVQSFGLNYRPIEYNLMIGNSGEDIFVYDTSIIEKNKRDLRRTKQYPFRIGNIFMFLRCYGYLNTVKDTFDIIKNRFRI